MAHNKTEDVTPSQQLHSAKPLLVLLHGTSGFSVRADQAWLVLYLKIVVIRPDYMNSNQL
jgi:hypothetical protein